MKTNPLTNTDMEFLNQVELRGRVGRVNVSQIADTKCVRMSVYTCYTAESSAGAVVMETMWHNVLAWGGQKDTRGVEDLTEGDAVYLKGRLRSRQYVSADGVERTVTEILANVVQKTK